MALTGLARTHSPVKSPSQTAQSNLTEILAMTMFAGTSPVKYPSQICQSNMPVKYPISQSNLTEILIFMFADDEDDAHPVMDLDSVPVKYASQTSQSTSQPSSPSSSSSSSPSSSSSSSPFSAPSSPLSVALSQEAFQLLRAPAPAVLYPDLIALFAMQGY